jgi:hypothetical protein
VSELEVLVDASTRRWRQGCHVQVRSGVRQTTCPPDPALAAELGRATRRAELELTIADAEKAMQTAPGVAIKDADPLASAVAYYLASAGYQMTPAKLSTWLYLVPVIFLEIGSAFGLAVASAVSLERSKGEERAAETANVVELRAAQTGNVSGTAGQSENADLSGRTDSERTPRTAVANAAHDARPALISERPLGADTRPAEVSDTTARSASAVRLLSFIQERGGVLVGGQRAMAQALGWSKSRMHEVLHELAAAGLVRLATAKSGTIVRLPA